MTGPAAQLDSHVVNVADNGQHDPQQPKLNRRKVRTMNNQNTQESANTPWHAKAASFSWRAPFIAFLVVVVGNVAGLWALSSANNSGHDGSLVRITMTIAAVIIAGGMMCSLYGMIAAFA